MSRLFDFVLGLLKWPVAILSLLSLPALIEVGHYFSFTNIKFLVFAGGSIAYVVIKFLAAARTNMSLQILAHEFTHIFFALLTFHKVVHVHLNMDESGGAMGFKGRGNWLIVIGPYFFPLVLSIVMIVLTLFADKIPNSLVINGILGYFFAYHIETIMIQIHPEQPDFKVVGFPFCWTFLPGANLFVCEAVLAFNNGGWSLLQRYFSALYTLDVGNVARVVEYITK